MKLKGDIMVWIKAENGGYIEEFQNAGERIVLIDGDYERTIYGILEDNVS